MYLIIINFNKSFKKKFINKIFKILLNIIKVCESFE